MDSVLLSNRKIRICVKCCLRMKTRERCLQLTATAIQELQSSGGVLLASGVSAEVGQWGAVARLQGGSYRDQQNVVSAAKFRVPQFHKMHDHATEAIKMRYMSLRQQGREQQFDGSMEHVAMDDANVVLLQVSHLCFQGGLGPAKKWSLCHVVRLWSCSCLHSAAACARTMQCSAALWAAWACCLCS